VGFEELHIECAKTTSTQHCTRGRGVTPELLVAVATRRQRSVSHKVTVSKASPVPVPEIVCPRLSSAVAVEACLGACIVRRLTCCSGTLVICEEMK
jgi:hypothetical protein